MLRKRILIGIIEVEYIYKNLRFNYEFRFFNEITFDRIIKYIKLLNICNSSFNTAKDINNFKIHFCFYFHNFCFY